MSLFKSDSLRRRFAVGVAVMLLPMLLLGGASFFAYEQNVAEGDKLANQAVSELLPMADLSASLRQAELLAYGVVFAGTPDIAYKGNAGGIDQAFKSILAGTELGEERGVIEISRQHWTRAKAAYEQTVHSAPLMKLTPDVRLRLHQQALGPSTAALDQAIGSAGLAPTSPRTACGPNAERRQGASEQDRATPGSGRPGRDLRGGVDRATTVAVGDRPDRTPAKGVSQARQRRLLRASRGRSDR